MIRRYRMNRKREALNTLHHPHHHNHHQHWHHHHYHMHCTDTDAVVSTTTRAWTPSTFPTMATSSPPVSAASKMMMILMHQWWWWCWCFYDDDHHKKSQVCKDLESEHRVRDCRKNWCHWASNPERTQRLPLGKYHQKTFILALMFITKLQIMKWASYQHYNDFRIIIGIKT